MADACNHLEQLESGRRPVRPSAEGCEECLKSGDDWVHLRLCLTCGHVGCCDSSPNKHAARHFHSTGHPVVKSFEPDEQWAWCYEDEVGLDSIPSFRGEASREHYAAPDP